MRGAVTIGMFDGVHVAHRRLLATAVREAKHLRAVSVAVTFDPDPLHVLAPRRAQPAIMPLARRLELIASSGIDRTVVIRFTRAFSRWTAERFVREVLVKRLSAKSVVVGRSFVFGRDRRGTPALLATLGRAHGFRVVVVPPVRRGGAPVSSSRVRRAVHAGRLEEAAALLGRPFELSGRVVHGAHRGRRLGYPTANLQLDTELTPPAGVYHVRVPWRGRLLDGVMNLGTRPTFGRSPVVCEVHLVRFQGRLYGQSLQLSVLRRLRNERRFTTPQALARQIARDLQQI